MTELRRWLGIGAAVDLGLAVFVFAAPSPILRASAVTIGEPAMYFRFAGLLLFALSVFYALGASFRLLAPAITAGAVAARGAGAIFLFAHLVGAPIPRAFWFFLVLDGAFAAIHAGLLLAWRRHLGRYARTLRSGQFT